jgi:hypothetical protein
MLKVSEHRQNQRTEAVYEHRVLAANEAAIAARISDL